MKEFETKIPFKSCPTATAENFSSGALRTEQFIEAVNKQVVPGEYFVYETAWSRRAILAVHLQTQSGIEHKDAHLFKTLRAFGTSNCLDFAVTEDGELYIPTKIYKVLSSVAATETPSDSARSSMLGLIDYITGIVSTMLRVAKSEVAAERTCSIHDLNELSSLDRAWNMLVFGKFLVANSTFRLSDTLQTDVYTNSKDTAETLYTVKGFGELRAVSVCKSETGGGRVDVYDTPGAELFRVLESAADIAQIVIGPKICEAGSVFVFNRAHKATETILWTPIDPTKTPVCDEEARMRLATAYNFKFKGTFTSEDFEVDSVREAYKDDSIAQELYKAVPEFYADIDLKNYKRMIAGIASGAIRTAMFFGESGTGKSTIARAMFNAIGIPYAVLNCSVNIEESDIIGTMIPNPEKKCADDPEFIWKDGILTVAARYGYGIVIEEINFARPGVLGLLNSLLDDAHTLYLPNGESVVAHKNFRMIATGNLGYEGTNRLNAALVNRFNVVHTFDTPNERETMQILKKRTGFENTEQLQKLYNAVVVLRKYIKDQNLSGTVSLRQLLNLVQCGAYYRNMNEAFVDIVLQGALLEYPEYFTEFRTTVLKTLGLDFTMSLPEG